MPITSAVNGINNWSRKIVTKKGQEVFLKFDNAGKLEAWRRTGNGEDLSVLVKRPLDIGYTSLKQTADSFTVTRSVKMGPVSEVSRRKIDFTDYPNFIKIEDKSKSYLNKKMINEVSDSKTMEMTFFGEVMSKEDIIGMSLLG